MKDSQYTQWQNEHFEIEHDFGNRVHILSKPHLLSMLAQIGSPECFHPNFMNLVKMVYESLFDETINRVLPTQTKKIQTRMSEVVGANGYFEGPVFNPKTPVVCVDLARAGTVPSQIFYERLNYLLDPKNVRQDHFYINRVTNKKGEVTGVNVSGSKIGGGVKDAYIFLPDPMGATGSTIVHAYEHYDKKVEGKFKAVVAVHMMVTPEYLKRVTKACPKLIVVAARLDRGLSDAKTMKTKPGSNNNERGLTDNDYIVPGAGGVGELLNNAFV